MLDSAVSEVDASIDASGTTEAVPVAHSITSLVETATVAGASVSVASLVTSVDDTSFGKHPVTVSPHLNPFVGKEAANGGLDISKGRDAEALEQGLIDRRVEGTEDVADDEDRGELTLEADNYEAQAADEDDELEGCEGPDGDDLDVEEVLIEMGLESRAPPDRTTMVKRAKAPPRPTATGKRSSSGEPAVTVLRRPRKKAKKTNSAPPETTPAPEEEPAVDGEPGEGGSTTT